jgi:hypothetical protein
MLDAVGAALATEGAISAAAAMHIDDRAPAVVFAVAFDR